MVVRKDIQSETPGYFVIEFGVALPTFLPQVQWPMAI